MNVSQQQTSLATTTSCTAGLSSNLTGSITIPGDKSISHRCLILASLAVGASDFSNLLLSEDVLATANILQHLGARITHTTKQSEVIGAGLGILQQPDNILDCGNSGTSARLLLGILASHPITSMVNGDNSLRRRPMARVIAPLTQMGAEITAHNGNFLPLRVVGHDLLPMDYTLPVASAQVKSAILLAALNTRGTTTIIEPVATRDHSERLMPLFGARLKITRTTYQGQSCNQISCSGPTNLQPISYRIPGDFSSAAFMIVAGLITENSDITLTGVGINPTRTGLLTALRAMGGDITVTPDHNYTAEPVANIRVRSSQLHGISLAGTDSSSMIDEYPILAVAAAYATGISSFSGIGELRIKESDRLAAIVAGMQAVGVTTEHGEDWIKITGTGRAVRGGAKIASRLDHRIAMSFLVLGLASKEAVTVSETATIASSYPNFSKDLSDLGAKLTLHA